jgi:hypothetical protein
VRPDDGASRYRRFAGQCFNRAWSPPVRPNQMLISAERTRTKKPLITTRSAGGIRGMSGIGRRRSGEHLAPDRHAKPKALNRARTVAPAQMPYCLLSIARLGSARTRMRPASCKRVRMAQTCFGWIGGFGPMSLPLLQGRRGA